MGARLVANRYIMESMWASEASRTIYFNRKSFWRAKLAHTSDPWTHALSRNVPHTSRTDYRREAARFARRLTPVILNGCALRALASHERSFGFGISEQV